jgi:two-component system, NtrC family, nitrogen regulation response regulator GlnG
MPDTVVNTDTQRAPIVGKTNLNKETFRDFPLEELVHSKLETFIDQIDGYDVNDLYPIVIERVERPLIQLVLKKTRGNQVRAASILGINRNTLRKKINHLKIKIKKPYVE